MAKHAAPKRPVSPKVGSAALGGGIVAQFILWILNTFVFGGDMYDNAFAAVPYAVSAMVTGGIVFAFGYLPSDEASALFASQAAEDPTEYGNAMGFDPALMPMEDSNLAAPLPDDTDDGTADEADADDEQPRDTRGRWVAEN